MTYVPNLDAEGPRRPRVPRTLDPVEVRILGALIEKQLTTPEYYPLTLNALSAATNQKSNREPVMELGESELERALNRLQDEKLAWRVIGGRAVRFDHNLDTVWHLNRKEKALLGLLFLRGPQTAGELRGRSDRLQTFDTVGDVEDTLRDMAAHSEPLVRQLPRRPGQKEERWAHTVGGAIVEEPYETSSSAPEQRGEPLSARVQRLEQQVSALSEELRVLKEKLGE
jgi:uncharacterized protein YceH (UPF0502 family)